MVPGRVEGTVVEIDSDGSLVTDIRREQLADAPRDESLVIHCDEHSTQGLFENVDDQPAATFMAVIGEDDRLRLTIVGISASEMLGIRVGEAVRVQW